MEKKWILAGLHGCDGIGWRTLANILSRDEEWEHAIHFSPADWVERGLTPEKSLQMSQHFNSDYIDKRMQLLHDQGIQLVTYLDESYPILMKETARAPWVIYAKGDTSLLSTLSVAMVGTRVPTAYGRKIGSWLVEELCSRGITIVSGLARGIDGVCHESALRCGGSTIAVLGTAIDIPYPSEHTSLYYDIAERGLIISEYPIGMKGHPGLFPQRNRIIAGITRGTVVVEADARSGSLITADLALESDRDVFAVPGPITSPKSRGTLNLLKQGAKIVTEPQDILEEYENLLTKRKDVPAPKTQHNLLTDVEQRIYHMLEQGITGFDDLLTQSGWDFGLLHSVLLSLIMKKTVVQLPGSVFKII
ncbi:DNA processing protein [Fontibacillus panacisegetis]|uniref:DNA processing protein n=1 Tax=Fontibacillus panacisegetis TaxID=670482 RepID=A0A1G7F2R5_9BACL|nr:DNA-processing protein DprA [Fontibacillus panacisegetis]SDE70112.1 DNA processing protein [Fontibacillus panacisegetis]